jgi:hypothetical protein
MMPQKRQRPATQTDSFFAKPDAAVWLSRDGSIPAAGAAPHGPAAEIPIPVKT